MPPQPLEFSVLTPLTNILIVLAEQYSLPPVQVQINSLISEETTFEKTVALEQMCWSGKNTAEFVIWNGISVQIRPTWIKRTKYNCHFLLYRQNIAKVIFWIISFPAHKCFNWGKEIFFYASYVLVLAKAITSRTVL